MKKIMLLGGSRYLLPVIETAHKLGLFVITCDYLPDNIAHKYSDRYCNVSIIDKEAVLKTAQELNIDGIMSFACDPGVVTAAYVAEQMGLRFQCSYASAVILQDKGLFRELLEEHGFNVPHAKRYNDKTMPFKDEKYFTWPVIVKPVDSAGSKGVTRVDSVDKLASAIDKALEYSHNGNFIIEDFLTFEGCHSSADPFIIDEKIEFVTYSDQLFDKEADNPYTPAMIIWPSSMKREHQDYLTGEIQRLADLLHLSTGIYNIETCVANNGKPYLMEVSPRGGGCKIAEIQELAFDNKFIENEIRKAINMPLLEMKQTECNGHWCEFVIHSNPGQSGIFKSLDIRSDIKDKYVKIVDMTAHEGSEVLPFTGANMSLGDMFLKFDSREELDDIMSQSKEWLKINLK
ncbi:MAG: ATP-grasp domain-containing protein [Clostridia bacterium]|nr:ATP-grasp domain-containing protein [Clostridia bacterium]